MNNEKHSPIEPDDWPIQCSLDEQQCREECEHKNEKNREGCPFASRLPYKKEFEEYFRKYYPDLIEPSQQKDEGWKEKFEYWLTNNQYINKQTATFIIDHVERYIRPEPSSIDKILEGLRAAMLDAYFKTQNCSSATLNNAAAKYIKSIQHSNVNEPASKEQEGEEKLFTLKEALDIWKAATDFMQIQILDSEHMTANKQQYFKKKFNVDL